MEVQRITDPPIGAHRSYATLIETLRTNDGWVSVSASEIAGATKSQKQTAIHAACQRAGLRVETRTSQAQVYVRSLGPGRCADGKGRE
jgi:hypothetical protein